MYIFRRTDPSPSIIRFIPLIANTQVMEERSEERRGEGRRGEERRGEERKGEERRGEEGRGEERRGEIVWGVDVLICVAASLREC